VGDLHILLSEMIDQTDKTWIGIQNIWKYN
jgi:hypothetical protein